LLAIQSCVKDESPTPVVYKAAVPANPVPANEAVVAYTGTGQTVSLTWDGTATNAIKWDVYFGTSSSPAKVATGVTTNSYTATVNKGGTYYWQVITVDANNVKSTSDVWQFEVNSNPNVPALTSPANGAPAVSITSALKWTCTDPEDDDLTYDLYLGTTSTPVLVASDIADVTYSPTLTTSTTYYWKIVAKDPYGGSSESVVYSFTTGALPISMFVGTYDVAENSVQNGAYAYVCAFTKVDNTTILADNWWDSGFTAKFTLDFTKNTIVMTPYTYVSGSNTYICTGSGKITQATGAINLVYSVTKNGVLLENGTEVFTLQAAKSLNLSYVSKHPKN
jgi:hypothetical protein